MTANNSAVAIFHTNKIYQDIDEAPFHIGCEVTVIDGDETIEGNLIGLRGEIEYYEYECGCGQSYPDDPMIGVRIDGRGIVEFWGEELKGTVH